MNIRDIVKAEYPKFPPGPESIAVYEKNKAGLLSNLAKTNGRPFSLSEVFPNWRMYDDDQKTKSNLGKIFAADTRRGELQYITLYTKSIGRGPDIYILQNVNTYNPTQFPQNKEKSKLFAMQSQVTNDNEYADDYFREKVAKDRTKGSQIRQPLYQQQPFKQSQQQNPLQQTSYTPANMNARVNTTSSTSSTTSGGSSAIFSVIFFVTIIIGAIFMFRSCSGGENHLNNKNAINEINHFTPIDMSGMSIGELLDGACPDGKWSSYETKENNGFFAAKTTWVTFLGNSKHGEIRAEFSLNIDKATKNKSLEYTCYVGGNAILLDELYRMFHDPNYENDLKAEAEAKAKANAEAENKAKFDKAEEKLRKMAFVHNYVVADFKGLTILEFVDSVSTSGDWSSNDNAEKMRVVYDGKSGLGTVQAIFDIDEEANEVNGTWYFNSKEINTSDLYQKFYPEK